MNKKGKETQESALGKIKLKPIDNWSWGDESGNAFVERRGLYYYGHVNGELRICHEDIYVLAQRMNWEICK